MNLLILSDSKFAVEDIDKGVKEHKLSPKMAITINQLDRRNIVTKWAFNNKLSFMCYFVNELTDGEGKLLTQAIKLTGIRVLYITQNEKNLNKNKLLKNILLLAKQNKATIYKSIIKTNE